MFGGGGREVAYQASVGWLYYLYKKKTDKRVTFFNRRSFYLSRSILDILFMRNTRANFLWDEARTFYFIRY